MTVYAVAWVSPNIKVSTTIDPTGSVNTTWHPLCILTVQKWVLQQRNANLQIDISSPGIFSNNHVASCSVPLSHFQEMDSPGADAVKVISFPVCGPSGQAEWMLNLSLKLGDVYQPSAMPGPSSAVAQTVEPNNNNPILAYSAGYPNQYNQAGGSLLRQALGGLGTMEGLLSGAGDAYLIGQTLFGGSGGGGQTPLGGSGGSGFAGSGYGGTPCAGTPCGGGGLGP
ncbi:unnamed protein product [Sphagnum jensenii]|uniref:Uncharacterized protein n=1 Tax=Sphagnum jensenii TaxID=128206 RepID=A0ABP0XD47_9BRYO